VELEWGVRGEFGDNFDLFGLVFVVDFGVFAVLELEFVFVSCFLE
jgi:hypothetical protein